MRANTKKKHGMGRRFAIVIGVAAVGVMALGAQTGAQTQAPTPPGHAPPTCKGKPATIVGTEGSDLLDTGTPGSDVIVGLGGADSLRGKRGNDLICGGAGNDILDGGNGKDHMLGEKGNDLLDGGKGKDRCEGGKGNDSTTGDDRETTLVCEVEKSIEKSGLLPPRH
jgi:Ca2+-binding RTX toxin-like protein